MALESEWDECSAGAHRPSPGISRKEPLTCTEKEEGRRVERLGNVAAALGSRGRVDGMGLGKRKRWRVGQGPFGWRV